ncbi:MAG: hypothetical protein AABM67_03210 [Acidobacteriota bacterium]
MLRKSFLILAVLCAAFLIGCSSTNNNNNSTAADGNKSTGVTAPSTPATTTTTTTSSTTSGEKIGIAECDDFLAKYEDCVNKNVPEAQRAQFESTMKQWRDSWRTLAKNEMTKGTLTAACKQAAESAKSSMKSYNCTF